MQQMEIWLVILFFSRKKFHAKQICVLSSSMKLGPGLYVIFMNFCFHQTGQLVISRGSLMYSDQSSNLLALDAPNPDADGTIKPNTAETTVIDPSVQDANQPAIQPKVS